MNVLSMVCAGCLFAETAGAQSPVKVTVPSAPVSGAAIPADFIGLSFETSNVLPGTNGTCFFSAENKPAVALFRTLGIKSLRIGGATADIATYPVPGPPDIDRLFAFAEAAEVKVIYTLRLLNGSVTNAVAIAQYIEQHYPARLDCFALGNEPDWPSYHKTDPAIKDYGSFLADWRKFASAITNAAPKATFEGPCTGSNYPDPGGKDTGFHGKTWTWNFAKDQENSAVLAFISQHDYPGQDAKSITNSGVAIDKMLSADWLEGYQTLYNSFGLAALSCGQRYRLEEVSNFSGGVKNASDTFAAALWALDFLHWWAAHHAAGVNFHNRRWIPNIVIHPKPGSGLDFAIYPIGYGIKACDLGSHGSPMPLAISNPDRLNLTAYAVRASNALYVTVINKEHGRFGRDANVAIAAPGILARPEVIRLTAPNGDAAAKSGVTLGGAAITSDGPWMGTWTPLAPAQDAVSVPAASAAVVKLPL